VKLALKMMLAVVAGILVVLSAFTYLRVRRLVDLFDDDMRKDHVLIGSTLAVPILDLWYSDGPERARQLVRHANAKRLGTHIGWLHRAESVESATLWPVDWNRLRSVEHQQRSLSGDTMHLQPSAAGSPYLVTHVPVSGPYGLLGALELATSFETRDRYIATTIRSSLFTALVMSALAAALMLASGVVLIGRPVARLTQKARGVSAAEPGEPLELPQNDELGCLAGEMNAMCERLAAANARAAADAAGRAKLEERLRDAERLITMDKLTAGIAHDLGTPLNIVSGRARMIVRGKVEGHAIVDYARSIAEQAARMTSIIHRLLEHSRHRDAYGEPVDLTASTADCVRVLGQVAAFRGVELVLDAEHDDGVPADPIRFDLVTTNLAVNVLQSSPPGSRVSISTGRWRSLSGPEEASAAPLALIRITRDVGGARQYLVEPVIAAERIGEGLELSAGSRSIDRYGDWVQIENELGCGSEFLVYLPQRPS
jgi:two-component system, NtrC family, sensor kinase